MTAETRADSSATTYTYETTTSRLAPVADRAGQVTTYTYAADNRLTGKAYTNETVATPDVTFAYDAVYPRVTSMIDVEFPGFSGDAPGASYGPLRIARD